MSLGYYIGKTFIIGIFLFFINSFEHNFDALVCVFFIFEFAQFQCQFCNSWFPSHWDIFFWRTVRRGTTLPDASRTCWLIALPAPIEGPRTRPRVSSLKGKG